jgi:hypothetical protein
METIVKDLPDISQYENLTHIPYLLAGILLVDIFVLFLTRYFPEKVGGETLNQWYDTFGLEGVIADVFIILIGFLLAQYFYSAYFKPSWGWKPFIFILVLIGVQVLHDVLFYYGVIKPIPKGHNDMMDMYKAYAEENGGNIILGDSLLMVGSALATFGLESIPAWAATAVAVLTVYTMPYILNTKMQGSYRFKPAPAAAPAQQQQQQPQQQAEQKPSVPTADKAIKVPISPWDNLRGGGGGGMDGVTAANMW